MSLSQLLIATREDHWKHLACYLLLVLWGAKDCLPHAKVSAVVFFFFTYMYIEKKKGSWVPDQPSAVAERIRKNIKWAYPLTLIRKDVWVGIIHGGDMGKEKNENKKEEGSEAVNSCVIAWCKWDIYIYDHVIIYLPDSNRAEEGGFSADIEYRMNDMCLNTVKI